MPLPLRLVTVPSESTRRRSNERDSPENTGFSFELPPPAFTSERNNSSTTDDAPPPYVPSHKVRSGRTRRRDSLRHTIGRPTASRKRRFRSDDRPSLSRMPRYWILVSLLLISFTALIMGFVYANCVALPHTNKPSGNDSSSVQSPGDSVLSGVYARQAPANVNGTAGDTVQLEPGFPPSTDSGNFGSGGSGSSGSGSGSGANPVSTPTTNTTSPLIPLDTTGQAEDSDDAKRRLGFNSPSNLAILFLYTATLPLFTIIHSLVELMIVIRARRRALSPADRKLAEIPTLADEANLRPLSLAVKHGHSPSVYESSISFGKKRKVIPVLSLAASIALVLGWITITSIQLHCEIHLPSLTALHNSPTVVVTPTGLEPSSLALAVCPIQTRGHYMPDMFSLSIGKNVLGWMIVLIYIAYVGYSLRHVFGMKGPPKYGSSIDQANHTKKEPVYAGWMSEGGMEKERIEQLKIRSPRSRGARLMSGEWFGGKRKSAEESNDVVVIGIQSEVQQNSQQRSLETLENQGEIPGLGRAL